MDSEILAKGNELISEIKYLENKLLRIEDIEIDYRNKKSIEVLNLYGTGFGDIKLKNIDTKTIDKIIDIIKKDFQEKLFLLKSDFILL